MAELIAKLQDELAIKQELDPVEQQMLRNREALATATGAQKDQVRELYTELERQKAATEALDFVTAEMGNALINALTGGKDAAEQLIQSLIRAGLQAAILGTGPLAGLFGGGGGGGLIGGLVGAITGGAVKKASGGYIAGPGGPTDDAIPAMLSNGEFVMNASATARNRRILEAMNSGATLPGFAAGGIVGRSGARTASGPDGAAGGVLRVDLGPGLVGSVLSEARAQAIQISQATLTAYDREALPRRFQDISRDPRRIG